MTLDVRTPEGREILLRLAVDADVLVENFRPGVLEGWGLGPDELHAVNPGLVLLRTTGFGQDGPYARRRAFGSLAEAMTGFAHLTGQADGPPTLPPFGLADGVAGITAPSRCSPRCGPATRGTAVRSSTCRSTSRCWGSWARRPARTTSSGWCRGDRATARATARRATPT